MKQINKLILLFALGILSGFTAFSQDTFTGGVFVLNEGGSGTNTSSISFISDEGALSNNIFSQANDGMALGNTAQNMGFNGNYAYVVMNLSNEIQVMNSLTLEHVATISEGLTNPRYIAFYGDKAYVSCWGNGNDAYIAIISLADNTVESTLPVDNGPERILKIGNKLYVAHQGGFGSGNTISVIDTFTDNVLTTVTVGDIPNSMVEKDGFLYVLCGGNPDWSGNETPGKLVKIDLSANAVVNEMDFSGTQHPLSLKLANDIFFYTIDFDVYQMYYTDTEIPAEPLLTVPGTGFLGLYGFDAIGDKLYAADAGNFVSPGTAYVYTQGGVLIDQYTVGVSPNGFYKTPDAGLGINDPSGAVAVSVYPNPASETVYIDTDTQANVKIYDLSGKLLKEEAYSKSGIDIRALAKGIYLAEITIGNKKNVQRLAVQ